MTKPEADLKKPSSTYPSVAERRAHYREYLESLIVAVIVALGLRYYVVSAYKIPTGSMAPTLKVGDFIIASRLPYGIRVPFSDGKKWGAGLPKRGDVVVFRYPGRDVSYVKRVVGLPGDRIAIRDRRLVINDIESEQRPLPEEAIADLPGREYYSAFSEVIEGSTHLVIKNRAAKKDSFGPVVVPPGHVFVLGDNRDSSDDSRYWGTIPVNNLEGRVTMVWLSLDWLNRWGDDRYPSVRWDRVLKSVR